MKIQNVGLDNAYAIVRGWVSDLAAAASGLISVTDETTGTTVGPVSSMTLVGQLLNDGGSGNVVVDIQAVVTEYTNNSGVDLVAGDVVVVDTTADIAVTTTTTAQDTRPVGIVLGPIGAGGTGPVQTAGIIQSINVTASVTRGYYAETSTTAKQATQNSTPRTGSFGIYLEGGTTPTVLLFGLSVATSTGVYETVIEGGGSVIFAHGNMGSTETFDPTDGNVHTGTLNAACTFTLNPPTITTVTCTIEIQTTQDGTGGWAITWPGSVTFLGGTPSPSTAAGATVKYILETLDGGTTWIAVAAGGGIPSASFATPAIVLGTAAAAGSASTTIRSDSTIVAFDATVPAAIGTAATGSQAKAARRDHVHNTGAGTPTTSAVGDAAATGSGPAAAMTDHTHGREAFATPAIVLGSSAAAGAAATLIRSDATIAAFDTTVPLADGLAATGSLAFASRADHVHPGSGGHTHVANETHLSDGSTGLYILDDYYEPESVIAWNTTTIARLTVTETQPDQATVSPVGASGDKIVFDYAATLA